MASGKQVLLKVLQKFSQKVQNENDLPNVSEELRAALCLQCSTSGDSLNEILRMGWLSHSEDNQVVKQGFGIEKSNTFLTDIFEELAIEEEIPDRIKQRFPELSQEDYSASLSMIWHLLSSLQYWQELSSVENNGVVEKEEVDEYIQGYKKCLKNYREEPW